MSNCQVIFQYQQQDIIIQCQRNELIRDIIIRYGTKSGLSVDEFYFLYNGKKIDPDLTLSQLNDKDKEILILVYLNENTENENTVKISTNYIKNAQNDNPAIVEFSSDYMITLSDVKKNMQKIKLQDYNKTQIVDQSKIKCSNCSNTRANIYQNKFYFCFECEQNFCPTCQILHQKQHKNIVDYSLKYFKCPYHKGQNFISYCVDCKMNFCIFCTNKHKTHDIINFANLLQEENKEFIEKIQKVKKLIDNIIDSLQKVKNNLDVYEQINEKLNENLFDMNLN